MKAELITRFRDISPTGDGIELVVWRVPEPVPPTTHGYTVWFMSMAGV